jgi:hypothetical protein
MPAVTSYTDITTSVWAIGSRTNATGGAVTDVSAEELRLAGYGAFGEGAQTTNSFKVAAQSSPDMTVKVGSGTTKTDIYVIAGEASGQNPYVVRHDSASVNVTVPAADASQARIDEVYLVVLDSPYDANTLGTASAPLSIPRIGYRKGVAGSTAPGVDSLWKASALLATITVPAAATTIVTGNIADARTFTDLTSRHDGIDHTTALNSAALGDLGDVASTSPSTGYALIWNGSTWTPGTADGVLATVGYNPVGLTTYTVGTGSTPSAVDATNLDVTVTVPASGKIIVKLEALTQNNSGGTMYWSLMTGGVIVTGTEVVVTTDTLPSGSRISSEILISGLTPGASVNYKWGARTLVAAGSISAGGGIGQALMRVRSA